MWTAYSSTVSGSAIARVQFQSMSSFLGTGCFLLVSTDQKLHSLGCFGLLWNRCYGMQNICSEFLPEVKESHNQCFPKEGTCKFTTFSCHLPTVTWPSKKNRYTELIRISRQMRKLQNLKCFREFIMNLSLLEVLPFSAPPKLNYLNRGHHVRTIEQLTQPTPTIDAT